MVISPVSSSIRSLRCGIQYCTPSWLHLSIHNCCLLHRNLQRLHTWIIHCFKILFLIQRTSSEQHYHIEWMSSLFLSQSWHAGTQKTTMHHVNQTNQPFIVKDTLGTPQMWLNAIKCHQIKNTSFTLLRGESCTHYIIFKGKATPKYIPISNWSVW